jgi:hypothetical protein
MKVTVIECKWGNIDLRDYNVKKCISLKQNYDVIYQGEIMSLSPDQLSKPVKKTPQKSKFGPDYELWSYKWEPNV